MTKCMCGSYTIKVNYALLYRVIVAGEIRCYVVGESAGVIKFDEAYGLSPKEAKIVSDHYPVMFHLQRKYCNNYMHTTDNQNRMIATYHNILRTYSKHSEYQTNCKISL